MFAISLFASNSFAADNAIRGDINGDKKVDADDVEVLATILKKNEYTEAADLNGDKKVTIVDLVTLVNIILYPDQKGGLGNEVPTGSGAAKKSQ